MQSYSVILAKMSHLVECTQKMQVTYFTKKYISLKSFAKTKLQQQKNDFSF